MSSFKLIALRPLEGCAPYIIKCLKSGTFYYLCNDYAITEDGKSYKRRSENIAPLMDDFFIINDKEKIESNGVSLNFSAIVGKNGDGKSTIIELIARIINNLAISKDLKSEYETTEAAIGVKAELYYQSECNIYKIRQDGDLESIEVGKLCDKGRNPDGDFEICTDNVIKQNFFFTFISNYSLYAYNVDEYKEEWNGEGKESCWMENVFHKNDGYAMPLTLHPMRDDGVIDVNRERRLSDQRILSLMINATSIDNPSSFRHVNDKTAMFLELKETEYSKFLQKTLLAHIKERFNKNLLRVEKDKDYITLRNYLTFPQEGLSKDVQKSTEIALKKYFENIKRKISLIQGLYEHNSDFFLKADSFLRNQQTRRFEFLSDDQDVGRLINVYIQLNSIFKEKPNMPQLDLDVLSGYKLKPDDIKDIPEFYSLAQIQWIVLIHDVCKIWANDYEGDKALDKADSFIVSPGKLFEEISKLTLIEKCHQYIVYKTIELLETYDSFNFPLNYYSEILTPKKHEEAFDKLLISFKLLINDVAIKKTHITLKLRQILHYLRNDLTADGDSDVYQDNNERKSERKTESELYGKNCYRINLDKLKDVHGGNTSLDILPPAIYERHLIFVPNDKSVETIPMEQLSSGERQRLQSLSAIIYHLQNLDSVGNDRYRESYKYINIILEEIELYFHPEYQRKYINDLRKTILAIPLSHIKAVNVTLVTHSPFILSDIPITNVLFLNDGKPVREMQQNTFGANIHSLLKNGFFMPTLPIGEFAHDKINELFYKLNTGDFKDEEMEGIYENIQRIGEPYIKSQLLGMYNSYVSNNITPSELRHLKSKVGSLEEEIRALKSQLNNDNDRH